MKQIKKSVEMSETKALKPKNIKIDDAAIFKDSTEQDDIENMFSSELGQKPESVTYLFNADNTAVKSDLTEQEISLIAILKYQARLTGLDDLDQAIDNLVLYRISKDRKSRAEFVQGLQSKNEQQGGGFLNKLFGNNNGVSQPTK